LFGAPVANAQVYREYFLAGDVEPQVFIGREVYFLKSWGSNTASTSYVEILTETGGKYEGRLVKISDYEIALSKGYSLKRGGERVERQIVIAKRDVMLARIYW